MINKQILRLKNCTKRTKLTIHRILIVIIKQIWIWKKNKKKLRNKKKYKNNNKNKILGSKIEKEWLSQKNIYEQTEKNALTHVTKFKIQNLRIFLSTIEESKMILKKIKWYFIII